MCKQVQSKSFIISQFKDYQEDLSMYTTTKKGLLLIRSIRKTLNFFFCYQSIKTSDVERDLEAQAL